jgi:hypothetical protein
MVQQKCLQKFFVLKQQPTSCFDFDNMEKQNKSKSQKNKKKNRRTTTAQSNGPFLPPVPKYLGSAFVSVISTVIVLSPGPGAGPGPGHNPPRNLRIRSRSTHGHSLHRAHIAHTVIDHIAHRAPGATSPPKILWSDSLRPETSDRSQQLGTVAAVTSVACDQ